MLLGHVVDKSEICVDPEKTQNFQGAELPGTKRESRLFVGVASYYRKLIR